MTSTIYKLDEAKPIITPKERPNRSFKVERRPVARTRQQQKSAIGGRGQTNSPGELKDHLEALKCQSQQIRILKEFGVDNRQLQGIFSGAAYTGVERFLKEHDGSLYPRIYKDSYNERIVDFLVEGLANTPQETPRSQEDSTLKRPPIGDHSYLLVGRRI